MINGYMVDYLARQIHAANVHQASVPFDSLHPDDRENYRWMVKAVVQGLLENVSRVTVDRREVWADRWSVDLVEGGRTLCLIPGEPRSLAS